ncbi:MAG: hypothetical protein JEZ14_07485 [Marinilabiliaceae bacterium]|nr:hypothetical protein [Marinilabiliaceae bacterium]
MRMLFIKLRSYFVYLFDRSASGSVLRKFGLLLSLFLVMYFFWWGVVTMVVPPAHIHQINKDIPSKSWSIVSQMLDPGNQHMIGDVTKTTTDEGVDNGQITVNHRLRLIVLLISLTGTFIFSGLLISTFTNIFEQRVSIVREGKMNYHYRDHIVLVGFHYTLPGILHQILNKTEYRKCKIVLLTSHSLLEVKQTLLSEMDASAVKRIHLLSGNRTSPSDLKRLWLPFAKEIFVLGETNEADHDSRNISCLNEMNEIIWGFRKKGRKAGKANGIMTKTCHVLFESQTTYAMHQFNNFRPLQANGKANLTCLNIHAFSFYEKWAQKVFVGCRHAEMEYPPLDFEPITEDSDKYVHLIVAGMTRMGLAMGLQAARLGHYANHERKKTRITFIDIDAERQMNYFASRFPSFFEAVDVTEIDLLRGTTHLKLGDHSFINVELCFVKGSFEQPETLKKLDVWTSDLNALTTIAVCYNEQDINLAAGLYLPKEIYDRKVRILIRQQAQHTILNLLQADEKKVDNRYANTYAFGMTNDCFEINLHDDSRAKAINYFYCNDYILPDLLDERIQKQMNDYWWGLKERFKWSSRYNAESIPTKVRAFNGGRETQTEMDVLLHPDHVELLARMEHARWNADTLLAGYDVPAADVAEESTLTADLAWKAYVAGGYDDREPDYLKLKLDHENYVADYKRKMIHPCLVPYEQLSVYYKEIDRRLVRCIPQIERMSGNE